MCGVVCGVWCDVVCDVVWCGVWCVVCDVVCLVLSCETTTFVVGLKKKTGAGTCNVAGFVTIEGDRQYLTCVDATMNVYKLRLLRMLCTYWLTCYAFVLASTL